MRNDALRGVIERDRRLKKILAKKKKLIPNGKTYRETGTGNRVEKCPGCGVLGVASAEGREAHAQRSPRCAAEMGPGFADRSERKLNDRIRGHSTKQPPEGKNRP